MIMILGSTHDDILYFESVMVNRHEEVIFDKYKVQVGTIFNQEVVLVHDVYTSYMSSLITSYIIQKYFVILVFVVGKCIAWKDELKTGDIVISRRVLVGDVDQILEANTKLGQIPGFPQSFETDEDIIGYLTASIEKRSFARYQIATFVSTNSIIDKSEKLKPIQMNDYVLGYNNNVVFDCTSGGVNVAAHLLKVPSVTIKVVQRRVDETPKVDDYIAVLKKYSDLGKAVVTCIGDIGHNDIIRGE